MLVLLHVPRRDTTALTSNSNVSVFGVLCVCVCMYVCVRMFFLVCLALFALCLPVFSFVPSVPKPLCAFLRVCVRASIPHHLTVSTPPPQGLTASDVTASRITVQVATIYGPCENYKVGMQQFLGTHTGNHHALATSTGAPT